MAYKDANKRLETRKKYKQKNKERIRIQGQLYWTRYRDRHLEHLYGLPVGTYDKMFVAQDGKCAICLQPETATRKGKRMVLAVDHDHTTGQVRQLLCYACNRGIGLLKDSPNLLRAAADYLEKQ